jgi:hypothetical protein
MGFPGPWRCAGVWRFSRQGDAAGAMQPHRHIASTLSLLRRFGWRCGNRL